MRNFSYSGCWLSISKLLTVFCYLTGWMHAYNFHTKEQEIRRLESYILIIVERDLNLRMPHSQWPDAPARRRNYDQIKKRNYSSHTVSADCSLLWLTFFYI